MRTPLLIAVGLLALVAIAFGDVRHYDFVPIDDAHYVLDNPHVTSGLRWANVAWAFTSPWASYWIPLTWISYMAEVQAFGVDPGVMHVTNVLLHAANTLLLFVWLRRTTGATWPSACVAALFGVHPLHVESVAWITERKDVLSTLFLLLALMSYAAWARDPARGRAHRLATMTWFVAGLLAKPMLVTLPLMLLLCDVWPLGRLRLNDRAGWAGAVVEKWPLFVIAAGAAVLVFITQSRGGATIASDIFPLPLRLQNAVVSYVLYLWQTIWPAGLFVNYPYPASIPIWQVAGAVALLGGVPVLLGALLRRGRSVAPALAVGWCWFVLTLLPVIGIVQVGLQPRADRFTYVPLIGLFVAVVWGAHAIGSRSVPARRALAGAAVVVIAACTAASRAQAAIWQDGVTLWTQAVAHTPPDEAAQPQFELGAALVKANHAADAIPHLLEATRLQPGFTGAHAALGEALAHEGRKMDARTEYERALRLDDTLPEIHNNLGAILAGDGDMAGALPHFEAAVRLEPDLESAQVNLGVVLARLGRKDDAMRALTAALRLNPSNAQARRVLELLK